MTARHGLVIGKFYPPHAGHHHLIRAAAAGCARVTVVVMASSVESLSLADRVRWLREVHAADAHVTITGIADDHPVDYDSDAAWRAHVALMREATGAVTEEPIDAVFTSEAYGAELARRFGARHVAVDPGRATHPVSGTAVRADPVRHWDDLAAPVREHLAWRVVLVGAESTGKTTLAAELAAALAARGGPFARTRWVPEVGRDVTLAKLAALGPDAPMDALVWTTADFVDIAREQAAREAAAARAGGPVLVCDTDAFATGIWHERYVGARDAAVDALGTAAPFQLYLLTHPDDVPFTQDGVRDGEHLRHWMTGVFAARLDADRRRWQWLRGDRATRLARAVAAVDGLLATGWGLAAPLGGSRPPA
ncbi:MAG TPA: AAA family ATPase [Kofleriaceae bacterium]|nr:AAA family ATPase [Kofleriaceae bacterium]